MSLNTANAFAALQKTSKKDKEKEKQKKKEKKEKKKEKHAELENAIFSQPSISVSNWADCDDDEDDDMDMPPLPAFGDDGEVRLYANPVKTVRAFQLALSQGSVAERPPCAL